MLELLSAKRLARHGMRRAAYDGANRRRFVLFYPSEQSENLCRREFDTKRERDAFALALVELRLAEAIRKWVGLRKKRELDGAARTPVAD